MTEDQLFDAVHEYTDATARPDVGAYVYVFDSDARAKLLEAIDQYSGLAEKRISELLNADLVREHKLLKAKAAVCDAYLEYTGGWSGIPKVFVKLYRAAQELKKLQGKAVKL